MRPSGASRPSICVATVVTIAAAVVVVVTVIDIPVAFRTVAECDNARQRRTRVTEPDARFQNHIGHVRERAPCTPT